MPGFNAPVWLTLFLLFPVLLWLRFSWRRRGGRLEFPFRVWNGEGFFPRKNWAKTFHIFTAFLSWFGAASLIFAAAGPERIEQEEVYLSRNIDIVIVLDQSLSMSVEDYPPVNRFDMARNVIHRFVQGRRGDSIGLVSFGTQAVVRCPPTTDYSWLLTRLDELRIRDLGDDTAIGMGLAAAVLHLSDSTAEEKVILLLTDGDDNAGEVRLETAMNLASEQGIRVYIIGVGEQGEAAVSISDPETGLLTSGTVLTRFDEDLFRSLTESNGGGYWHAASPGTLETVFRTVDSLETVERRVSMRVQSRPIHRLFIIIGAAAVLLSWFIRRILMGEAP
ncbi:MAG: hypothetical protein B0D92_02885 [Spirochaeta sp. LUC14_002_19_P3]|nr:MAG: hypothetical protein B0D92_02885 [Spirochaeta sp. LUC14_002_19_P3]